MTKRHFEALAAMVRGWQSQRWGGADALSPAQIERVACELAVFCAQQNDRFDRDRFLAACKGEDSRDSAGRVVRYSNGHAA